MDNLFSFAAVAGVQVLIPQIVAWELEKHWRSGFDARWREATEKVRRLLDHSSAFTDPKLTRPTLEAARADYLKQTDDTTGAWNMSFCSNTRRPLEELLEMAAFHSLPFPDSDASFRDAVILLSAADYLDAQGTQAEAILLSKDGFFKHTRFKNSAYLSAKGYAIHLMDDISVAQKEMTAGVVNTILDEWSAEREQAISVLNEDKPRIEQFVKDNLEVPISWAPKVVEVRGLTLVAIVNVAIPISHERPTDGSVKSSFDVLVELDEMVEIRESPPASRSALRVGQTVENLPQPTGLFDFLGSGEARREIRCNTRSELRQSPSTLRSMPKVFH